jgi:hypothetical protein
MRAASLSHIPGNDRKAVISERDNVRFTKGDCHYLAQSIQGRTGWPIHCIAIRGAPDCHSFVVTPDGRAIDVEGVRPLEEVLAKWERKNGCAREFSFAAICRVWGHAPMFVGSRRRAQVVADILLASL